ncbi:MAG: outer membrane protein assembly factor BamA, partial [Nitrospinaceae bacterium]|nr:outer membrane protein assembly factor BamA [Nitrospinaceae bacterium]NIR57137.1 outer membrane protein assembly factor BamA [Nitrospinaceae bacterium]NIS87579.1 outer membrane protein assembly factor BamA [Nitrospinaceae bacterium]NIT84448.1 outer membrane protein assembly factor BamA [Nitrospinaceae bacterium]NIU46636.1 outer membrane protein assembly factor BamA [Nitrospinaceae bacterium]
EPADDGGVQVIFVVREIPSVAEITFVGNENLDDEDLREEILIKRGITFKEHLIKDTIQKLKAFYSDKAYFLAEVDVQTKLNANGQMDVTIHIKEGEK